MSRSTYASATGTERRCGFLDAHTIRSHGERSKRVIAIVNEIARRGVFGKGFAELLRGPRGGRMRGDGDVSDVATPVGQNDQDEQQSIGDGRQRDDD